MLKFPKLLSDGCVLQQGDRCRIWGFSTPGGQVTAALVREEAQAGAETPCARETAEARAAKEDGASVCTAAVDKDGRFEMLLLTLPAGGPYLLTAVNESGEKITVRDVYVGDVFVCSGQSNIELPMCRVRVRFPEEFCNGGAPDVRLYKVVECYDFHGPYEDHVSADWTVCTSENLEQISALSYFIGKELAAARGIPVGLINLSLGGTPVEAWMSREGLREWPELLKLVDIHKDGEYCRDLLAQRECEDQAWYQEIERQERQTADAPFQEAVLPGCLADWGLKDFCGCLYLRRSFEVPAECAGRGGLLRFGTLIDSDRIYINGELVGETGYRYPPRRYPIREGLLKAGENEIVIRLICREGDGRVTPGKPLDIIWEDGYGTAYAAPDAIDLSGAWEYQVRAVCAPAPEQIFINRVPTGLFHGMVAPCLPCAVKGVVWYQGESNDRSPHTYAKLLQDMIRDWRAQWRQEELPFVIVQLPNCDVDVATGDAWPLIREAQMEAETLADVAVTVNLDLGEDNDLHPLDKKTAAERAVLALRAVVYREDADYRGPRLCGAVREENCVRLTFAGTGGELSLTRRGGQSEKENPRLFELAGADGVYYPAEAQLIGAQKDGAAQAQEVLLRAEQAAEPRFVRYAWDRAPGAVLLYGKNGLPAAPFRCELAEEKP